MFSFVLVLSSCYCVWYTATDVCCRNAVLHADSPIDRLPLFRMEGEGCERLHQNAVGIISVLVLSHNPHHT